MKRKALAELLKWRNRAGRKPLVLRGARQVGKSYLARALAEEAAQLVDVPAGLLLGDARALWGRWHP
jgi:DNA replication protein DnaC